MKLAATIPTCVDYEMELQLCLRGSPTHRCANGNQGSTTAKKTCTTQTLDTPREPDSDEHRNCTSGSQGKPAT